MIPRGTFDGRTPIRADDPLHDERRELEALRDEDRGESVADDYDPDDTVYNWPQLAANFRLRNDLPEPPDPWDHGQIICDRCSEPHEPWCDHGNQLCAVCAPFACQTCECQLADYAALIEQRRTEHYR